MPQASENKYLHSVLEDLITSYETEINYTPKEVILDPHQITSEDMNTLSEFLKAPRKRLFIFKIPGDEANSTQLALLARKTILSKTAEITLKNTSITPKINSLKKVLDNPSLGAVRAGIQIQKSFTIQKPPTEQKTSDRVHEETAAEDHIHLIDINLSECPELEKQLHALDIKYLQDKAALLISEHVSVFKDGIIPKNLPTGFYINQEKHALCYTTTPMRLPTALAPTLENPPSLVLPPLDSLETLVASMPADRINLLMNADYSQAQQDALITACLVHGDELKTFFKLFSSKTPSTNTVKAEDLEFLIPFLSKQFLLGGEAHATLLTRLLTLCVNKKISLEFIKYSAVQEALLSTRGIKNLQKLLQLPAEQKEWWNTLVKAHLRYDPNSFDFNTFFEAYTQIALPRVTEKNLTLPNPCPINHDGHLLITLNRVLDVIEHAKNPQDQCLSLASLNWGPTGVHYAMVQKPEAEQFRHVAACMDIKNSEDTITDPERIYQQLEIEGFPLKPWLFRYMGQRWKVELRLSDIEAQLSKIEQMSTWTSIQKTQFAFILTCTFSDKTPLNVTPWKTTLELCLNELDSLSQEERSQLLQALSRCFKFKPSPSLVQIHNLIKYSKTLKEALPNNHFKDELLAPLVSCLEHEGFELLHTLQECVRKTSTTPENPAVILPIIASFMTLLQKNRHLPADCITLLSKLNEPDINQEKVDHVAKGFKQLADKKGESFHNLLLNILSQIDINKSDRLPTAEDILNLLESPLIPNSIPEENGGLTRQEPWLKDLIITENILPGCVLGNGDISHLDDLIVNALVDAIQKRRGLFSRIGEYREDLFNTIAQLPGSSGLINQLKISFFPLIDRTKELMELLLTPKPKFSEVIDKLHFFEEVKPKLLAEEFNPLFGWSSKGIYLLSFLMTGKKRENDTSTSFLFEGALKKLWSDVLYPKMVQFFKNPKNKASIKDLDLETSLDWMKTFNDTHSLIFFFKEELVEKKVVPALKKVLQQLNTQDQDFEKSILDQASTIAETIPSDQALQEYKNKIEGIADYLNLLIDIKDKCPDHIYKQLNSGTLARLNYRQKHILISNLLPKDLKDFNLSEFDAYLKLATEILENHAEASQTAIERSTQSLPLLFSLPNLDTDTRMMFFKMSMTHNLKNTTPFPLEALNTLKKSKLAEKAKSSIIKQLIPILGRLSGKDSSESLKSLVKQIRSFLTLNPIHVPLCLALIKRISLDYSNQDLETYTSILKQLEAFKPENSQKIAVILTQLANNRKDESLSLSALLEISKGLGRRSTEDVELVLQLFNIPPCPSTQNLNSALLAHDSDNLRAFCSDFDLNPFAQTVGKRKLAEHFSTDRIKEALLNLEDLLHGESLPHSLQIKLAKQLTYIETLGHTDALNPKEFNKLNKLTLLSRRELKEKTVQLLQKLRSKAFPPEELEITQLELLACLREVYFKSTGLFPNTTQMLVLLLALHDSTSNLLMRIKTGEGKSINAPMLSVLQWLQGGTVIQFTANSLLLLRDYENSCQPFYDFIGIPCALIRDDTNPVEFQLNGINCSTVEDMSIFYLRLKEFRKESMMLNGTSIHIVLDECDDGLLDQTLLYKLVAEISSDQAQESNHAQWIYPLARQFINLTTFRNINSTLAPVWDEEEDIDQFRQFLNKEINEKFNGDAEKQNYLLKASNTQLMLWIHASCVAATQVENKHFIVQPIKEKDEWGNEITKKIVCVPLIRSIPKTGSIFTAAVQQALQARLMAEHPEHAHCITIDRDPPVLASISALGLIKIFLGTKGRLLGISGTPGDTLELQGLATSLGTQALGIAPHAGEHRKVHEPLFIFNEEELISKVHTIINNITLSITKPTMEIDRNKAIQTHEEREALIQQTQKAIAEWNKTQTQPILIINEDFEAAEKVNKSLESYKKQGFNIQIVTGKETQDELERIIKKAGRCNTITVGTAMLAKGIDINTADHPKGLFVIQTYTDTDRMTTQIAGRAARNGKPGEWQPIYKINPPTNWFKRILYYIFPWYRKRVNERSVAELKNTIKLQVTLDRLYTQAIDEAQSVLMNQIEAWEDLLMDLNPGDLKLQFELYQWRETLLNELSRSQDAQITQETFASHVNQFKSSACKLWDGFRDEKWAQKAQNAAKMTDEQELRFQYLKQMDLAQEFNVQFALKEKTKPFVAGAQVLRNQNLDLIINDKAGIVLKYTKPDGQMKKDLELAQSKQLLPNLIAELCSIYPEAVDTLIPKNPSQKPSYLFQILHNLIKRFIEHKNRLLGPDTQENVVHSITRIYDKELKNADAVKIEQILVQIKNFLLNQNNQVTRLSISQQFQMQGLISTFYTLYQNSNLPKDAQLKELKTSHTDKIMRRLAQHLMEHLGWVKEVPPPLHAFFERRVVKNASHALYDLAEDLMNAPQDKNKIQALFKGLEEHQFILKDYYLFSMGHANTLHVIKDALAAIESLEQVPFCDKEFRNTCHDTIISEHHLSEFRNYLTTTSPYFFSHTDITWDHLKNNLLKISNQSKSNQAYVLLELHETINRYIKYKAYQPYLSQLKSLNNRLIYSLSELKKEGGLRQDIQEGLLDQKKNKLAALLHVNPNQVTIQKSTDGVQSFIDLQIKDSFIQEGFSGYQTSFYSKIETAQARLKSKKADFKTQQQALQGLANEKAGAYLSEKQRVEFDRLRRLKSLLDKEWDTLENQALNDFPEDILNNLKKANALAQSDWTKMPDEENLNQLKTDLGPLVDNSGSIAIEKLIQLFENRNTLEKELDLLDRKLSDAEDKVMNQQQNIKNQEDDLATSSFLSTPLKTVKLMYEQNSLNKMELHLTKTREERNEHQQKLEAQNQTIKDYRSELLPLLTKQAKHDLTTYLDNGGKGLVQEVHKEFEKTKGTIKKIKETEQQKSTYQTYRFFKLHDILDYEAKLTNEEGRIPLASKI